MDFHNPDRGLSFYDFPRNQILWNYIGDDSNLCRCNHHSPSSDIHHYRNICQWQYNVLLFFLYILKRFNPFRQFIKSEKGYLVLANSTAQQNVRITLGEPGPGAHIHDTDNWTKVNARIKPDSSIWSNMYSHLKGSNPVDHTENGEYSFNAEPVSYSFGTNLLKFYFTLTSVFTLASSATLKDSQTSIPRGTISGIAYTAIICISILRLKAIV